MRLRYDCCMEQKIKRTLYIEVCSKYGENTSTTVKLQTSYEGNKDIVIGKFISDKQDIEIKNYFVYNETL